MPKSRIRKQQRTELERRVDDVARSPVLKAVVIGDDGHARTLTNTIDEESVQRAFTGAGALAPPFNMSTLCELFEVSSALRPSVESYVTNIDGNGHHFEPTIDLDADDLHDRIANAVYVERLAARDAGQSVPTVVPTAAEVEARIAQIDAAMRVERFKLEQFFESCVVEESFVALRKKTRQDLEVTGNAMWEVLRDTSGRVCQFIYVASHTVRLLPQAGEFVDVTVPVRVSEIAVRTETLKRRFRRFVQVIENRTVYFREYGDPRVLSSTTGRYYPSIDALRKAEPRAEAASEILHFRIHAARTPYGVPRWTGAMLSVLGMRQADEVNFLYFENKSVPPLALLVSGGRVSQDSVQTIRDYIENEIKGSRNFHKILVIEAEGSSGENGDPLASGRLKLELRPLTSAQQSDALFQKYDERGIDKVGMQFRLSRMLRGDVRDFNRATADAALEFAEAQVFGPERIEFDHMLNRIVLASLGIRFWRFVSNSTVVRDPKVLADIIARLTSANVLVPNDARRLAAELVFASPLPKIDADWVYQPVMLSQVGLPLDGTRDGEIPGLDESTAPAPPGSTAPTVKRSRAQKILEWANVAKLRSSQAGIVQFASNLLTLRDELVKLEEERAAAEHLEAVRAGDEATNTPPMPVDLPVERITMSEAEMRKRFKIGA